MNTTPNPANASLLNRIYTHFAEGKIDAMLELFPENATFQVYGKSPMAGKYTRASFKTDFAEKMKTLTGGSYQFSVHDVFASDLHGVVLGTVKVTLHGKTTELRMAHIWRIEKGVLIAGYEYTRDLYQHDSVLGG